MEHGMSFSKPNLVEKLFFGSWFDHVLDFEKCMADNPDVPVYIQQLEEMKQKPVECVKKLCAFLGKPDTLAEDIVANSSVDSMKTAIKVQTENNVKWFEEKAPTFIQKVPIISPIVQGTDLRDLRYYATVTMAKETPREIVKRCMPHVKYEHLDGVLYQQFSSPCLPKETFEKLSRLELNAEDVFSTGWPRSGNHWTYYVVDMILKQSSTPTTISFLDSIPDVMSDEQLNAFAAAPSPRLFCSHLRLRRFPDIARKSTRVIYVIRNPKDAMVSFYKVMSEFVKENQFNGTWDEFFEVQLGGESVYGPWFDHVLAIEKFMADNPNVPVYIHQFEEMKQKPVACVKKLCAFLGKSDTFAEDIVANSCIERVEAAVESQSEHNVKFEKKAPTFIQKGEIGSWKNHFTVAQNEKFDEMFENKMKGSKLAQKVRQYI